MTGITKICKKCGDPKDIIEFHKNSETKDGRHGSCKECKKDYDRKHWKEWASSSPEKKSKVWKNWVSRNAEYHRQWRRGYEKTLKCRFIVWRTSAKERKIPFDISFNDVELMPMKCYYTGLQLTGEPNQSNTISLDRLDSDKSYTKDNVVFCCAWINLMKHTLPYEQFISACRQIVNYHDDVLERQQE